jgi:hypothetical protein
MKFSIIKNDFNFFINKIKKNEYFSIARFNHGIWDKIVKFKVPTDLSTNDKILNSATIYSQGRQNVWKASPSAIYDCFDLMKNFNIYNKNKNFYLAVSHLGYPHESNQTLEKKRIRNLNLYNNFINESAEIYNGLLFKQAILDNSFQLLLEIIIDKNVIIVAPNKEINSINLKEKYYMENFGKRFGIKKFAHLDIHPSEASLYYYKYIQDLKSLFYQLNKNSSRETVILFKAGPVGPAMMKHLHGVFEKTYMIDVGNAFDIFIPELDRPWKKYNSKKILEQERIINKYDKI